MLCYNNKKRAAVRLKGEVMEQMAKKEGKKPDYNIFLIGFMGAGKSTVASALQQELGMELVEMDEELVRREGMSINDVFATRGEDYFRDAEGRLIEDIRESAGCIVSCGGGVVVRQENVRNMKANGRIVLLTAEPETVYERVKDSTDRPVLNGNMNVAYISGLMEKRREAYLAAADLVVATDGRTVEDICGEITGRLGI